MAFIRLQKFFSQAGFCSRRKSEKFIKDGAVRVNGKIVAELGTKINPDIDRVEVSGEPVEIKQDIVYIALNKPKGYVTSCSQPGDKIVTELINIKERIYPVGRLDKDSSGLLILTNDGRLHHRLLHPSFDHEKEYEVSVATFISNSALMKMEKGMALMGTKTRPAEIKRLSSKLFRIIMKEGKNRQIRRMVKKVGNRVTKLKRIRVSNITLNRLTLGKWRYLEEKEKKELLQNAFNSQPVKHKT